MTKIESHVPQGPITEKWSKHKADIKVVSRPTSVNSISSS